MCGIIGYVGKQQAAPLLIEGLKRLEYRGYDSAGVAVQREGGLAVARKVGRVANLEAEAVRHDLAGSCGLGHTRWATHGAVTEANAHPHVSSDGRIALIHNGVIENFSPLKAFLLGQGWRFQSETDSEVLGNLIAHHYARVTAEGPGESRLIAAVRAALRQVEGTYGIVVMAADAPGELVTARQGSPLILGLGDGENLIASDVAAIIRSTRNVVYLKDGEIAGVQADGFTLGTVVPGGRAAAVVDRVDWSIAEAGREGHATFMEKEIFEQPAALENALRGRISADGSTAQFGGLNLGPGELPGFARLMLCGCGSALHACLVTEHLVERFARLPTECDHASEFRYRNAPLDPRTLFLMMSQSGETIDTLAALREAQRRGCKVLAVTNVVGSTLAREADGGIYQHAGPEVGVASTKAFTSQLLIGALLALHLGRSRDLGFDEGVRYVQALRTVPDLVRRVLDLAPQIRAVAQRHAHHNDMLFLGRLSLHPIALEGALKLKEISYVHAEGYPAAEMKHGPIALVSETCPSVFLVPGNGLAPKIISSMQEIRARRGPIIAVVTEDVELPPGLADDIIAIPNCHEAVLPIVASIPLQLLSHAIAVERGCEVDRPRNLAKSVTVE